jgi:hypothetical protein
MPNVVKVQDNRAFTFWADLDTAPWVAPLVYPDKADKGWHLPDGRLRVVWGGEDAPPDASLVVAGTVAVLGPGRHVVDLSLPCNWPQAARVSAGDVGVFEYDPA